MQYYVLWNSFIELPGCPKIGFKPYIINISHFVLHGLDFSQAIIKVQKTDN
jgi:hypothetical protein